MTKKAPQKVLFDSNFIFSKASDWDEIIATASQTSALAKIYTLLLVPIIEASCRQEPGALFFPKIVYGDLPSSLQLSFEVQSIADGARLAKAANLTLDEHRDRKLITNLGRHFRTLCLYHVYERVTFDQIENSPQTATSAYQNLERQREAIRPSAAEISKILRLPSASLIQDALTEEFGQENFSGIMDLFSNSPKNDFKQARSSFTREIKDWEQLATTANHKANFYFGWINALYNVFIHPHENAAGSKNEACVKEMNWMDLAVSSNAVMESLAINHGAELAGHLGKPFPKSEEESQQCAFETGSCVLSMVVSRVYEYCAVDGFRHNDRHMAAVKGIAAQFFTYAVEAAQNLLPQKISADPLKVLAERKFGPIGFDQFDLAFRNALFRKDVSAPFDKKLH